MARHVVHLSTRLRRVAQVNEEALCKDERIHAEALIKLEEISNSGLCRRRTQQPRSWVRLRDTSLLTPWRNIGLEAASKNLLAHYSLYAKKMLVIEGARTLQIKNGSKPAITWIYKYMCSGEADGEGQETLESFAFPQLMSLYTYCAIMKYQSLMDRIVGRLELMYDNLLPGVEGVKISGSLIAFNKTSHKTSATGSPWERENRRRNLARERA